MNNVSQIGRDCTNCGACTAFCPTRCIDFQFDSKVGHYLINLDESKCVSCGICTKVCPVISRAKGDFGLNLSVINRVDGPESIAAYSMDPNLRKNAASGGFITSFLCFLLDNGYVDGVLLSRRNGVMGKSYIATSKNDIIHSKTSIYAPVNTAEGFKELKTTGCSKIAVVGLPCQIQALSNIRKLNKKIDNKIVITISIVCGKTPTANAYKYIARHNGFSYEDISSVSNRGNGWPGFMTIKHLKGTFQVPYPSKMSMGMVLSSPIMCASGCNSCLDGYGITADISVCDAWLPKYTQQKSEGWNLVLLQTEKAKHLIKDTKINEYLHIEEETVENFYRANKRVIDKYKMNNSFALKEHQIAINPPRKIKKLLYIRLLKTLLSLTKNKDKSNINIMYLIAGKIINKLKD